MDAADVIDVIDTIDVIDVIDVIEDNIFLNSLEELTEKDIDLNETAKTAKKPPVDFVRYFMLLVCVSVFLYASYYIVQLLLGYAEAANENDLLREMFYGREDALGDMHIMRKAGLTRPIRDILSLQRQTSREVGVIITEGVTEADQRRVALAGFFATINDMYGWLRVSGTNVDYAVVQADDDEYYLRRNVYGFSQQSGSIFVDHRNDKNVDNNLNTILYGHNMANNTMFGTLLNYAKDPNVFNNGFIELITPDGVYIYEVFSSHVAHPLFYYRETSFSSEERYVEWLYEMKALSRPFHKENIEFTAESRIITLSTCTNTPANPRFAIHGVLVDVLRYSER
ncbi:MAG: class B sortase [Oscillospiraceae bacterium]|nr:class B sortase [Oscillospiraceae bacterium]